MTLRVVDIAAVVAALVPCATAQVSGQDQGTVDLQVQVTSVSGRDVYIDRGRSSGVAQGQIVRLFPPGAGPIEAEVKSVSSNTARAELRAGAVPPPAGTRGEITVPKAQPQAPPAAPQPQRPVPEHPPWTRTLDPSKPDEPLLVPTFGQKPDERPMTLDGRAFASTQWNRDDGGDRSDEYLLSRIGISAEATNTLGFGERTRFAGEFDERRAKLPSRPDTSDLQGRVDEASVAFGTEHWAPVGVEVGRFLSPHLPEIGLVDGAETVFRYAEGLEFGAGFGAYPRPFPGRASGEDLGAHVFAQYVADNRRSLAASVGLQKTWHRGAPDRDLLLLRLEGRPTDQLWLYGNAKVDYYTSGDNRKQPGLEVTEFLGQAQWNGPRIGFGTTYTHFAWPDLLRVEYQNLPDDLVRNGRLDRVSLSTWLRPVEDMRFTGRADSWQDQDNSGTSVEVGMDWSNFLKSDADLSVQAFRTDGGSQSGPGLRITARKPVGETLVHAGYGWYGYQIDGLLSGSESYTRQVLEVGASWAVGDFDMDLQAEHRFGDKEHAFSLAFYVQWRF